MSSVDVRAYLAADETLHRRWDGAHSDAGVETGVVGATDRRLLFCSDAGSFWDVAYEDIGSIETRATTRTTIEGMDYRAVVGGGATLSVVGFVGAIGASTGLVAFALVFLLVLGLVIVEHGWKHQEAYDGFVRRERPLQRVMMTTSAGRHRSVDLFTTDDVGSELGRLVRGGDSSPVNPARAPSPPQVQPR